ncbi:hypothetical protein LTR08_002745 [Meristemomyces frigidus]|nr:hypothetical protein LTR08_002745 [Meristemomyces frigidus]
MASGLRTWIALAALVGSGLSQTITARNWTATDAAQLGNNEIDMSVSVGDDMVPLAAIVPLTSRAGSDMPPPGLSGPVILANYTSQLDIQADNIAVISCDSSAYTGNIGPLDVFATAEQSSATGIVWYSTAADWCDLEQYSGSYAWVYSMKSLNDTQAMLGSIDTLGGSKGGSVYITIGSPDTARVANGTRSNGSSGGDSSSSSHSQQSQQNPLGPSPSTAVAMIILYSITGIITALFLVIIITGAVRAHRHPERYGPRNVLGRPRQSRARGLARAMLETIPIVKFGEREAPKPTDVELADGTTNVAETHESEHSSPNTSGAADTVPHVRQTGEGAASATENGIAAATNREVPTDDQDNQGCSICTEDFEIGQDQRVLPCNHRFHPACIDPWLLNVSGTCPLCRIDLRPQASSSSDELDEHGNPVMREGEENMDGMAPPLTLDGDAHRTSVRRSLMLGFMGIGRPERLTRDERVLALREYRDAQAATGGQEGVAAVAEGSDDERGLRTRLRNAFRIRTRRTEQASSTTEPTSSGQGESSNRQPGAGG